MKKDLTKLREVINNEIEDAATHRVLGSILTLMELMDARLDRNEAWLQNQTAASDRASIKASATAQKIGDKPNALQQNHRASRPGQKALG